tara:strand:- start:600 stop:1100 length:501 start_codon:yes stop_codon:yes gene_type:complete
MPLKKCTVDGKAGYQWGDAGKCYTGRDAKKKAIRQGVAVEGPEKFSRIAQLEETIFSESEIEAVADTMHDLGYDVRSITATASALRSQAMYDGYRTTSMDLDRDGYGHFHTFKRDDTDTSRARTKFGDIIIGAHEHAIVDGKIQPADGHTHEIKDIGPGDGWIYGD